MKTSNFLLKFYIYILPLAFIGCSQTPLKKTDAEKDLGVIVNSAPNAQGSLPKQELSEELLYHFLLAEIAAQRSNWVVAAQSYAELANATQDARVAQRAVEIAIYARMHDLAIESAKLWLKLEPKSSRAKQMLIALMVNAGQVQGARPYLQSLLNEEGGSPGDNFMQFNSLFGKQSDKAPVLKLISELAASYPDLPEAHFAVAQAALAAQQPDKALLSVKKALNLRPDWEIAALFQAQILQRSSAKQTLEYLDSFLQSYPKSREVRLFYARLLAAQKSNYELAREQFKQLNKDFPDNADLAFTIGLISLQLKDWVDAEKYFNQALSLKYKNPDNAHFYLAQALEGRKDFAAASKLYSVIQVGEFYLPAQIKKAGILAKQNKLDEARKYLHQVSVQNNQQRVQIILAEAQLLRDATSYQEAFDLLSKALEKLPNYTDLLYDHAMVAEKVERLDILEQNLRKVIQLKPDHAHAYNALGYTLADRTNRLTEAKGYIEQALKLAPDDPFIMDSMGWVEYRLGNLNEGASYLRKAFAYQPDPEIAAHLGEVLWKQGKREEAFDIWQGSLKENPDNQLLRDTLKKFKP